LIRNAQKRNKTKALEEGMCFYQTHVAFSPISPLSPLAPHLGSAVHTWHLPLGGSWFGILRCFSLPFASGPSVGLASDLLVLVPSRRMCSASAPGMPGFNLLANTYSNSFPEQRIGSRRGVVC
jgi:hypothetical protein